MGLGLGGLGAGLGCDSDGLDLGNRQFHVGQAGQNRREVHNAARRRGPLLRQGGRRPLLCRGRPLLRRRGLGLRRLRNLFGRGGPGLRAGQAVGLGARPAHQLLNLLVAPGPLLLQRHLDMLQLGQHLARHPLRDLFVALAGAGGSGPFALRQIVAR